MKADCLLINEQRGRAVAKKIGVRIIGLPGVFLLAKKKGIIKEAKPYIDNLITQTKFRHSQKLIDAVLKLANEK